MPHLAALFTCKSKPWASMIHLMPDADIYHTECMRLRDYVLDDSLFKKSTDILRIIYNSADVMLDAFLMLRVGNVVSTYSLSWRQCLQSDNSYILYRAAATCPRLPCC